MDRAELSEHSIHEVGALFEAALREAAAELSVADLDGIERRLQAVGRAVLGRVGGAGAGAARGARGDGASALPALWRSDAARGPGAGAAHRGRGGRLHDRAGLRPVRRVPTRAGTARRAARAGAGGALVRALAGRLPAGDRGVVLCRLGIEASFEEAMDAAREALGATIPDETARR